MDAVIHPPQGKVQETARLLLRLADHPTHVMTQSGGNVFRVPEYLHDRYVTAAYVPAPKRRGRPPKIKNEVTQ